MLLELAARTSTVPSQDIILARDDRKAARVLRQHARDRQRIYCPPPVSGTVGTWLGLQVALRPLTEPGMMVRWGPKKGSDLFSNFNRFFLKAPKISFKTRPASALRMQRPRGRAADAQAATGSRRHSGRC